MSKWRNLRGVCGAVGCVLLAACASGPQARGPQAVDIVAKIDVRQITLKNFVLRQTPFQPESDEHFPRLAGEAAFGRQKGEFGKLLCNCAAALGNPAANGI